MSQFKQGDTVYLDNGQAAEFVAVHGGTCIVLPMYECEDGVDLGSAINTPKVYAEPPVTMYSKQIEEMRDTLADLTLRVDAHREKLRTFESAEKERRDRIARHNLLEDLDNFLAGKITHVVELDHYGKAKVVEWSVAIEPRREDKRDSRDLRLLTLFGARNKTKWMISYYPDGSGSGNGCWIHPFTSFEAARAFAVRHLQERFDAFTEKNPGYIESLIGCATELGMAIPSSIADWVRQNDIKHNAARVLKAQQDLAAAEKELAEAMSRVTT